MTACSKRPQYLISRKSVQLEPCWHMWTVGRPWWL